MTSTPKPTEWHRKPRGHSQTKCPICDYPAKYRGQHRLLTEEERSRTERIYSGRWIRRITTAEGRSCRPIGSCNKKPRKPRTHQVGPTPPTEKRIARAAGLTARGKTCAEIAGLHNVTVATVLRWKRDYSKLWQMSYDRAMAAVVKLVRAEVGTDAILEDPDGYITRATRAEKWLGCKGEPLLPSNDSPTLCSFYWDYYLPNCMAPDASASYKEQFEIALRRWRLLTGNPPLKKITIDLLSKFRDAISKMRGLKPHLRMTPIRVAGFLTYIQRLLDKAGPPGPRNRDAAGILNQAPWIRPPRVPVAMPEIITQEQLSDCYRAAIAMSQPKIPGFKPGAWWRALLAIAYNTALRRGNLFGLMIQDIDWHEKLLLIPAERMKAYRDFVLPLNDTAMEHLRRIRTDRQVAFLWPMNIRAFHVCFHKLQSEAGIPQKSHFGLHSIRRTTGTVVAERFGPEVARLFLGHAPTDVTMRHYVRPIGLLTQAAQAIPQPEAFRNGDSEK